MISYNKQVTYTYKVEQPLPINFSIIFRYTFLSYNKDPRQISVLLQHLYLPKLFPLISYTFNIELNLKMYFETFIDLIDFVN